MRKLGFITDIQYNSNYIENISITIYNEELNQVVTISPSNFNRLEPYEIFQQVEYSEKDNSIKPYIPKNTNGPDLTPQELNFQQKSLLAISADPRFETYLLRTCDTLLPPKSPKR